MMNLQYVAVIKDSQMVSRSPSEIYSQIMWYYITQRGSVVGILLHEGALLSAVCRLSYDYRENEERKMLNSIMLI